jgi:hypothetical protein
MDRNLLKELTLECEIKDGNTPLDKGKRPEVQDMIKNHLASKSRAVSSQSSSSSSAATPSLSSSTAVRPALSSSSSSAPNPLSATPKLDALPPFFTELFAKASITDAGKQRDYAQKLSNESMDSASSVVALSVEQFKTLLDIPLGDGSRIIKAANEILQTPAASSSPASHPAQPKQVLDPSKATVMISYRWDSQPSALYVRDYLLSMERFNVIIDVEGIRENFLSWMEWAVRKSDVIIMLITPKYEKSNNCEKEACRAHDLRKKTVPIMLDPIYNGEEWLAILIAGLIRYDGA